MPEDEELCQKCKGLCCRYVALEIDEPETADDFDTWRWYVSHEGCAVYREEGRWYFEVITRCKNLTPDNRCAIYARRPNVCRQHNPKDCEMSTAEYAWDVRLETLEDVEAYARLALRNKKTRGNRRFDPPWERRARAWLKQQGRAKGRRKAQPGD